MPVLPSYYSPVLDFEALTMNFHFLETLAMRINRFTCSGSSGTGTVCTFFDRADDGPVDNSTASLHRMIPESLLRHLTHKLKLSLDPWKESLDVKEKTANALIDHLVADSVLGSSNKLVMENGLKLSRALSVVDRADWTLEKLAGAAVHEILQIYDLYIKVNHEVYDNITNHHNNIVNEDWSAVATNESTLSIYSDAAHAMGSKVWVVECNKWFEDFSIAYYRKGGARKHYLKKHRECSTVNDGSVTTSEGSAACRRGDDLVSDLMTSPTTSTTGTATAPSKIRLVDVGSCYNPIAKSENADEFVVTALDLYPAEASVLQCDFLNLHIGTINSDPEYGPAHMTSCSVTQDNGAAVADVDINKDNAPASKRQKQEHLSSDDAVTSTLATTNSASRDFASVGTDASIQKSIPPGTIRLLSLPAASYDVVTMCLVLSYLPTPEQRLRMVQQARSLLITPGCLDRPHYNGLLLIAEKQSIFKPPFKMHTNTGGSTNKSANRKGTSDTAPEHDAVGQTGKPAPERDLWTSWAAAVCSCGFELVKYHYFPSSDGRKSHLFAFGTVGAAACSAAHGGSSGVDQDEHKMWIKQDFER